MTKTSLNQKQRVLLFIYQRLASPLAVFLILSLGFLHPRLRGYLKLLIFKSRHRKPDTGLKSPLIWIHAASGEFEYAKPLLAMLKKKGFKVLITFTSENYAQPILKHPEVDFAEPLPLDLKAPLKSLIHKYQPEQLWFARTDLWPTLIDLCIHKKIPVKVFSARWTQKKNSLSKWMALITWVRVNQIAWVNEAQMQSFKEWSHTTGLSAQSEHPIDHPKMTVAGDTRYDQVLARLEASQAEIDKLKAQLLPAKDDLPNSSTPILVAGSTWPADEDVLIDGLRDLLQNQQLRCILVPHEPTASHLDQIRDKLERYNLTFQLFSEVVDRDGQYPAKDLRPWDTQVLLVDRVGLLAELYALGQIAFVGGSFHSKVHSILEPLACGLPVLVGPKIQNSAEAMELTRKLSFDSKKPFDPKYPVVFIESQGELNTATNMLLLSINDDAFQTIHNLVKNRATTTSKLLSAFIQNN